MEEGKEQQAKDLKEPKTRQQSVSNNSEDIDMLRNKL